ncbi:encapsulin-associated ferritin-like protein [Saccharicrinis sp. FJH62]|uniref:encapsulin-associated ferritin-like protein n=1 Tax=Saccharicrinis sp. FJH62 TaxID=3344657 RepID=UPI0035D40F92
MSDYHEPAESLSEKARSLTRALNSLKEEIEAVDWYNQRYDVEKDKSLKNILKHNMEEEMEHACMTLEWLRRNMDGWDNELRENLFKEGEIGHH